MILSDRLDALDYAQHIALRQLGEIGVAPSAACKVDEQQWVFIDPFQAFRTGAVDAIMVTADADVVVACDASDVLEM